MSYKKLYIYIEQPLELNSTLIVYLQDGNYPNYLKRGVFSVGF
jgi:hypothetical protein